MNFAVLLAAGGSSRFRDSCPPGFAATDKLQTKLSGKPLWRLSFDTLLAHPEIAAVGVVCPPGREADYIHEQAAFATPGGATRLDSSRVGVAAAPQEAEIILVHDAARPFLTNGVIDRVLAAAKEHGAAIPAVPVTDTLKRGIDWVSETVDRKGLLRVQTPQAARRDWLLSALGTAREATDESMALEQAGHNVRLVEGDERNIKITIAADLPLQQMRTTTGFGYDIHPFSADHGRPLILGGVVFDGALGLEGHSDADVVLHAVTDALLGAVGLGDIGEHFPNTDPRWKNADSRIFLRHAVRMLEQESAQIESLDITVLAETPRISGRRSEIRETLSKEMGVEARRINVKATTAEGLGAIGRGEGIAAMAVAAVSRPIEL